jgi:hypothetical protein
MAEASHRTPGTKVLAIYGDGDHLSARPIVTVIAYTSSSRAVSRSTAIKSRPVAPVMTVRMGPTASGTANRARQAQWLWRVSSATTGYTCIT